MNKYFVKKKNGNAYWNIVVIDLDTMQYKTVEDIQFPTFEEALKYANDLTLLEPDNKEFITI